MSGDRVRGIQVHRSIIYGSTAMLLTEEERATAPPGLFLTSATSPPPPKPTALGIEAGSAAGSDVYNVHYLPGGADDLSYLIKKVTFKLYETYTSPNRIIEKPPYSVTETGWGEFTVFIRVQFVQEAMEKPLQLSHTIKLHHWGAPIEVSEEAAAAPATAPAASVTPAATVASAGGIPSEKAEADGQGRAQVEDKIHEGSGEMTADPTPAPSGTTAEKPDAQKTTGEKSSTEVEGRGGSPMQIDESAKAEPVPEASESKSTTNASASDPDPDPKDAAAAVQPKSATGTGKTEDTPIEIDAAPEAERAAQATESNAQADITRTTDEDAIAVDKEAALDAETSNNADTNANVTADPAADEISETITVQPLPSRHLSIAARLPVHAWQYDELVFTDPPANFLSILNANPPTPLPNRNRRPRDQREAEMYPGGAKSKKGKGAGNGARSGLGRSSTLALEAGGGSRAGTQEPATPAGAGPGGAGLGVDGILYGINGEPGSADVPLEFSVEMEKAEWNLLEEARISIIDQMDRWRETLIAKEKELAKLKEEMSTA